MTEKYEQQIQQGRAYISQVHHKMSQIVREFANGEINRTQFHQLYDRYQRQVLTIEQYMAESNPDGWQEAIRDDVESTYHLRKSLTARPIGISVYDNRSGMPIETIGNFSVDADLLVPMLSSYRSAAREIFKSGMRSTALENGNWLCFVPGHYSTLLVLFSLEPATNQLTMIERMHHDFETANTEFLEHGYTSADQLAYPFYGFIHRASLANEEE